MMCACPRGCGNVRAEEIAVKDEQGFVEWCFYKFVCMMCKLKWYSL